MMSRKVFLIFLFCISFISCLQKAGTHVIRLNLENNEYKEFVLRIQCYDRPNPIYSIYFDGVRDGNTWTFTYPDTLYDKSIAFTVDEPTGIDTLTRYIGFKYIRDKDTLRATSLSFAYRDITTVNAVYLQTDTARNVPALDKNGFT